MHYSVVIDAGSSGSRAFIYQWPSANELDGSQSYVIPIETRPEWITRVTPGISSFHGKSKKEIWLDHLKPLIQGALAHIPRQYRADTAVFFLATAGLRLLEQEDRNVILADVCSLLSSKTPFLVGECSRHVTMIDGETEGLYGWLGLNYMIHTRDNSLWTSDEFDKTYGFMDMGGASTQIAFVPNATESERHHDDLYTVSLRTNNGEPLHWKLFVTTWLGFGANQAQRRWRQFLVDNASSAELQAIDHDSPLVLSDPCLQMGAFYHEPRQLDGKQVDTIFHGSGDFNKCEIGLEALLNYDKPCKDTPCLFNGVHVPAFDINVQQFIGISEYWYTVQDLYQLNGKFDYATFLTHATDFCQQDWNKVEASWEAGEYGHAFDKAHLMQGCFKTAWVLTVLHKGFKFPLNPADATAEHNFLDAFQSVSTINGLELSWTMGKAIMYASSQIASSGSSHQVGFVSDKGDIMTEDATTIIQSGNNYFEIVVLVIVVGTIAWIYRQSTAIRKKFGKGWESIRNEPGLPDQERRQWASSRPCSRNDTPVYPQYELNDMSSPRLDRSPVFGQFRDGTSISSSVPVSRAPSRVGSRLNISTMQPAAEE